MRVLNKIVRFTKNGIKFEFDQRCAEIAICEMDLCEANPVLTPYDNKIKKDNGEGEDYCDAKTSALYRSVAARLNYLSPDRADIQYVVKEVCRTMASPRLVDLTKLKRIVRYLIGRPRMITHCDYQTGND